MKKITFLFALMAFLAFNVIGQTEVVTSNPTWDGANQIDLCLGGSFVITITGTTSGHTYTLTQADSRALIESIISTGGDIAFNAVTPVLGTTTYTVFDATDFSPNVVFTSSVIAQPTAPTMTKSPDQVAVCAGTDVSAATLVAGSGGVTSCTDSYEYSTDGGTSWSAYTSGTAISTTGLSGTDIVQILATRSDPDGRGCDASNLYKWTVNALPSAPTAGDVTACFDGTTYTGSATVGTGEVVDWYDASTGGNSSSAPSGSAVGSYTSWAEARVTATGCVSTSRTLVTVTINALPSAPTGNDVSVCYDGNPHTGSALPGPGESIVWYDAATGGNVTTAPTGTDVGTYTAYAGAQTDATGCESASRTLVTVTIKPLPDPSVSGPATVCANATETYTTETGKSNYSWSIVGGTGTSTTESIDITWDNTLGNSHSVTATYTDVNSCPGTGSAYTVTVEGLVQNTTTGTYYCTIQDAIIAASSGDAISVAAGTFVESGQIVIDKNLTISGAGSGTTIVKTDQNTGNSGDARGWWLVETGISLDLSGMTLDGSGYLVFQAIRQKGFGTIDDVYFTQIKYNESGPDYAGMAVAAFGTGDVDITNSTFDEIGRIGVLYFGTGLTATNFTGNTYTGKGIGNWLDYALDISAGANINVNNNTISGNRGVASSDGSTSAGILVSTFFATGTTATITDNTLTDNTAGVAVGYDASDVSLATINNNNIYGNDYGVTSTAPQVDATLNWWGDASGPSGEGPGTGDAVSTFVDFCPWLGGDINSTPATIAYIHDITTDLYYCSIQDAIDATATTDGDVIEVTIPDYTEPGYVTVTKSLTIQGQGIAATTVRPNINTSSGGHGVASAIWISTAPGKTVHFKDMTLDATGWDIKYGVVFQDDGSLVNVGFNEFKHSASPYLGIAAQVLDGNVDINGCTFTEIGRIGVHYRNGVIAGATISGTYDNNTYTGKGDGDWLDYALDISGGTTITVSNNTITANTGVATSDGSTSGAIMATTYFPFGLNVPNAVTIIGNDLTANTTGIMVGYDANDVSVVTVHNNKIYGNDYGLISTLPPVDAENNWWGDASGPYNDPHNTCGMGDTVVGDVDFMPWWTDAAMTTLSDDLPVANVTQSTYYCTIQDAVDDAVTGDQITVAAGSYEEQVTVDGLALTITGAGNTQTFIEAPVNMNISFSTSYDAYAVVGVINDASLVLSDLTVDGLGRGNTNYKMMGVAFRNSGGTVDGCKILNIENTPFSGAQHGVGVYAYNDDAISRTINVTNNEIDNFQKNAMALNAGMGTTAMIINVSGNTVTGHGATTITAQNGIQAYGDLITGTITGNTISGIAYDNTSSSTKWVATSILNYYSPIDILSNTITGAHMGIYNIDASGTIASNNLTIEKIGVYAFGIIGTDPPNAVPQPYDEPIAKSGGRESNALLTVAINDNTVLFSGTDNTATYGIEVDAGWGPDDLLVSGTGNDVTGFEVGFEIYACQSGCDVGVFTGVEFNNNLIYGNTIGMRSNVSYLTVDAENNWWGDASGPYNDPYNTCGLGNEVIGDVDFMPWWTTTTGVPSSPLPIQNVTKGTFYCSIQDAIDDATPTLANPEVITVGNGTFLENITVDKEYLTLANAASSSPIIDGNNLGTVVTITADNVTMYGFTIQNTGVGNFAGIALFSVNDCNIHDNMVTNNQFGIALLDDASNNIVKDNIITLNTSYGVLLDYYTANTTSCTLNTVDGNIISVSEVGIYLGEIASENTLISNTVQNNFDHGIELYHADDNIINANTINGNTESGIRLGGSQNTSIINNTITGGTQADGIRVFTSATGRLSTGTDIHHNTISGHTRGVISDGENVDASANWWGDETGPYHNPNNTCGLGNLVSDDVDFFQWWDDASMTDYYVLPDPNITCLSDQVRCADETATDTYTTVGTEFDPTVVDVCRPTTITNDQNASTTLDGYVFNEGTTTVTWTITDVFGNDYYCIYDVTINALPDPVITGDFEVCAGATGEIYSTPLVSGNSYLWNVNGGTIASGQGTNSITVDWFDVSPGTLTVTEYAATTFCSETVSEDVTLIALPTPEVVGPASVVINTTETYSTTTNPLHAYTWTVTGGSIQSGQNTSSITVLWPGTPGTGTVMVTELNLISGCVANSDELNVTITPGGVDISGIFTYHNFGDTPLDGLSLDLMQGATVVGSTSTDAAGYYEFNNVLDGTYSVAVTTSKTTGGVNSVDAGGVNYWFTHTSSIEHVKWNAGDVNTAGDINATDAGDIQAYFVNPGDPLYAFARGEWTFWKQPDASSANPPTSSNDIVVSGANVSQNFYGMCVGDFNGSNTSPGSKSPMASDLMLTYDGSILINSSMEFELPIKVTSSMQVAALSLILEIPSHLVTVEDVFINNGNIPSDAGALDFNVIGDELRIGWNSIQAFDYSDGNILLTLKLRTTKNFGSGDLIEIALNPSPLNELANGQFEVIDNVVLSTYTVEYAVTGIGEFELSKGTTLTCYPNPFNEFTFINYNIPVDGEVKLEIYNMYGSLVESLVDELQIKGEHTVKFHSLRHTAGVYTANIRVRANGHVVSRTIKIVLNSN